MTCYYRTKDPAVLAEFEALKQCKDDLVAQSKVFAEKYGAKPLYRKSTTGFSFAGLRFEKPKDTDFWTRPDGDLSQTPRAKPKAKGLTKEQKDAHEQLRADFKAGWPRIPVDYDGFYASVGTDWGILSLCGARWFLGTDGYIYFRTSAKLGPNMEEIRGSEFMRADEDQEAAAKLERQRRAEEDAKSEG